jgi:hypothetical protein
MEKGWKWFRKDVDTRYSVEQRTNNLRFELRYTWDFLCLHNWQHGSFDFLKFRISSLLPVHVLIHKRNEEKASRDWKILASFDWNWWMKTRVSTCCMTRIFPERLTVTAARWPNLIRKGVVGRGGYKRKQHLIQKIIVSNEHFTESDPSRIGSLCWK